jgi:hypothetical protein
VTLSRLSPALQLFALCLGGSALVHVLLLHYADVAAFSDIFRYFLKAHDLHGNYVLLAISLCALALRTRPEAMAAIRFAAERPWTLALALFPILCLGSVTAYHAYPLSMDEYATLFQARAFAAGRLDGVFPPDLIDRLILRPFQGMFLIPSRTTGHVATGYWPGFSALLAPFVSLGIPWAANPLIAALTIPSLHRLTRELTGSKEAAGWAVLLTVASPVFMVTSISYYSMPAHLLCDLWYGALLIRPTPRRALLAGVIGSVALVLHVPVRHILFSLPFFAWLVFAVRSPRLVAALVAGYLPLCLFIGIGWQLHLADLRGTANLPGLQQLPLSFGFSAEARIAGLTKVWTWGALALVPLAAIGYWIERRDTAVRLFACALAMTFVAYVFFGGDQGHGWGNRALYSVWFVLPVLAAIALTRWETGSADELRRMCAWGALLCLVFANALRLLQADTFIASHLRQVPPLVRPADPLRNEIVLLQLGRGFYTQDMIHNDPFLRGRIVLALGARTGTEAFMNHRFPGYSRASAGEWGELWVRDVR